VICFALFVCCVFLGNIANELRINAHYKSFFADPMRFTVLGATIATESSG